VGTLISPDIGYKTNYSSSLTKCNPSDAGQALDWE